MKDYELKKTIIQNRENIVYHKIANKMDDQSIREILQANDEKMRVLRNLDNSWYYKTGLLKRKISYMLTNFECVFLTLTFTDKVLNSTTQETRRRYISRWLKSKSDYYIANIDYGSENEREHYHAIINCRVDNSWEYGAINFKQITNKNEKALAKYINKLTNHAIKATTKQNKVIYSSGARKIDCRSDFKRDLDKLALFKEHQQLVIWKHELEMQRTQGKKAGLTQGQSSQAVQADAR